MVASVRLLHLHIRVTILDVVVLLAGLRSGRTISFFAVEKLLEHTHLAPFSSSSAATRAQHLPLRKCTFLLLPWPFPRGPL